MKKPDYVVVRDIAGDIVNLSAVLEMIDAGVTLPTPIVKRALKQAKRPLAPQFDAQRENPAGLLAGS